MNNNLENQNQSHGYDIKAEIRDAAWLYFLPIIIPCLIIKGFSILLYRKLAGKSESPNS